METEIDMEKIQEEAKRRFPIGCKFRDPDDSGKSWRTLKSDYCTYEIRFGGMIYANSRNGCLYKNGVWATPFNEEPKPTETHYEIY